MPWLKVDPSDAIVGIRLQPPARPARGNFNWVECTRREYFRACQGAFQRAAFGGAPTLDTRRAVDDRVTPGRIAPSAAVVDSVTQRELDQLSAVDDDRLLGRTGGGGGGAVRGG